MWTIAGGIVLAVVVIAIIWLAVRWGIGDPWKNYYTAQNEGGNPRRPGLFF